MTKFKRAKLYVQGKNECTLVTLKNIVRTQWGIIMNDTMWARLITAAENTWLWTRSWGAVFRFIYNWFTGWFYKEYNTEIDIYWVDIMSDEFEKLVKEWKSFWLGLMYASNWYRQVRADWKITLKEVKEFDVTQNRKYGHNHTYKLEYIIESLASVDDKIIKFPLKALREAVNRWIYWPMARTINMKDELLSYYLTELNKWTVFEHTERLNKKHRTALDLALKLRIVKR